MIEFRLWPLRVAQVLCLWVGTAAAPSLAEPPRAELPITVPLPHDFLAVDEGFAEVMSKASGVKIEPGLYLGDVRKALLLASLRPPRFAALASYSARYLFEDPTVSKLLGKELFRYKGAKLILHPSGSIPRAEPFDETQIHVGWAPSLANPDARALWAVRDSGEAWEISVPGAAGKRSDNRLFSFLPTQLKIFPNGVAAVTLDGKLHWKSFDGPVRSEFERLGLDGSLGQAAFQVASFDGSFALHRRGDLKMLAFAAASAGFAKRYDIYALGIKNQRAELLAVRLAGPIRLTDSGVYYFRDGKPAFRAFSEDWSAKGVGARSGGTTPPLSETKAVGESLAPLDAALVNHLGNDLGATDLLNSIRTGTLRPAFASPALQDRMSLVLGREGRDTLAVFAYSEGAMPEEVLAAYVQRLDIPTIAVPSALAALRHVFLLRPGKWADESRLMASLETLRQAAEQPGVVVILSDYPASVLFKEQTISDELLAVAVKRMEAFQSAFAAATLAGRARVVVTARREIVSRLAATHPHFFNGAAIVEAPALSQSMVTTAAGNFAVRTEAELAPLRFSEEALTAAVNIIGERLRDPKNTVQAPALLADFIAGVGFTVRQLTQSPDNNLRVTAAAVNKYGETAFRRWRLIPIPNDDKAFQDHGFERGDLAGPVQGDVLLVWVHPDEPPRQIDPSLMAIWQKNNSLLTSLDRLEFAALSLPADDADSITAKVGVVTGRTVLLQPNHPLVITALNFIPRKLVLHSRGFFFFFEDNKELSFCTYVTGTAMPVRVLKSGLSPDDLPKDMNDELNSEKRIAIAYEGDIARLSLSGATTSYDAEGKEVANP